jgi:cytochrome c5
MQSKRNLWLRGAMVALTGMLAVAGCYHTPVDTSDLAQGPAPRRMPSPEREESASQSYEDSLTGGQVFEMYCSYCHNAPNLGERNFANFKNVATHMRARANLTGKEYARLMEFLQRWNDVPPRNPPDEPSPKRLIFPQPLNELREQQSGDKAPEPAPAEVLPPSKQIDKLPGKDEQAPN